MHPLAAMNRIILAFFVCVLTLGAFVEGFIFENAPLSCYHWVKDGAPGVYLQPELNV